jgi:hypothetical protein
MLAVVRDGHGDQPFMRTRSRILLTARVLIGRPPIAAAPARGIPRVGDLVSQRLGLQEPQNGGQQLGDRDPPRVIDVPEQVDFRWAAAPAAQQRRRPDLTLLVSWTASHRIGLGSVLLHIVFQATEPEMNAAEFGPDIGRERRQQPADVLRRQRLEDPRRLIMQHDVDGPVSIRWHGAVG